MMSDPRGGPPLTQCEREPIHTPGSIQPHGALLMLAEPALRVVMASASAADHLGRSLDRIVGARLSELTDGTPPEPLSDPTPVRSFEPWNPMKVRMGGRAFDAIVQRVDGLLLVELEPTSAAQGDGLRAFYGLVREAVMRLQATETLDEMCAAAAAEVRHMTNFDRVMVYRFDPAGHGTVIAEERRPEAEPYLGLRYPASDIPRQARRLYLLNRLRLIPDVDCVPSPLVPPENPLTRAPLDLSHAALRSVPPVHVEYLRNMRVRASMSISLVLEDRQDRDLWGLIACHHGSPHYLPYEVRLACEFLGQVVSFLLGAREQKEQAQAASRAAATIAPLMTQMSAGGSFARALVAGPATVMDLVSCAGAAAIFDGETQTDGRVPPAEAIAAIAAHIGGYLDTHAGDPIERESYDTDSLARDWPEGAAWKDHAAGVLAIRFSPTDFVLWFRPEEVQVVTWGGDPQKSVTVESDGVRLSPRKSFARWREEVRLEARPWASWEIAAARALRDATTGIVLRKAAEVTRLNQNLRAAVRARDELVSMASHELRTPITTLQLQLEGLVRLSSRSAALEVGAERVQRSLAKARAQIDRLSHLMNELLDVSRIVAGRLSLQREEGVDLGAIVREVAARFEEHLDGATLVMDLEPGATGALDALRMDQVVTNLLSNALKYGQGRPIDVSVRIVGDELELEVQDHGVGISEDEQQRIFERFERARTATLHSSGFGLGLWIVREFVEAHGGRVSVWSRPGQGATFLVRLPRHPREDGGA